MIADLKPYPAYRDSGSLWLGAVPSHWEVQNLRTLIRPYNERNRTDLLLLSVARAGNLVINKMKAWQGLMGIAPCDPPLRWRCM
jgi:type I restriction enzyme, S subunit